MTSNATGYLRTTALLAVLSMATGCSWFGWSKAPYSLAPSLEMGRQLPEDAPASEPFALTNEGRKIEDRLLDGKRKSTLLP